MKRVIFLLYMICSCCIFGVGSHTVLAAGEEDIIISEKTFPDPAFRKAVGAFDIDKNQDGVLSKEERQRVKKLTLVSDQYKGWENSEGITIYVRGRADFYIKGIEVFENVQSICIRDFEKVRGSLKGNARLTEVEMEGTDCKTSLQEIKKMLPLNQLKKLTINHLNINKFSIPEAKNLQTLTIKDSIKVKKIDVSKNKALKSIMIENCSIRKLDLRKNKKLSEVSVQFGTACFWQDLQTGKTGNNRFFKWIKGSCEIQFSKKNEIKTISYFTIDKMLDVSQCKKLREVHVSKNTKVKTLCTWYEKASKKKIQFFVNGICQKRLELLKKKKYVWIKGTKFNDNMLSYLREDDNAHA